MEISVKINYRGTKMQELRKKRQLSQSQLAEATGISVRMIQKYEQGEKDLNGAKLETILRICAALDCKMIDILNDPITVRLLKNYGE